MNAVVWVQALTLGAALAALGWGLTAGPLRLFRGASRDFLVANAWVALGALCWWPWSFWAVLDVADGHRLAWGLMGVLAGLQWLCLGLHKLHHVKPSYVVSPVMLPFLAVMLLVVSWLEPSGHGALLATFSACLWMVAVSVQQGFPAMMAHAGTSTARWGLAPLVLAACLWLAGMALSAWALAHGAPHAGDGVPLLSAAWTQPLPGPAGALAVVWALSWGLVNGGLMALVLLRLVDKIRELSTEDDLTGAMNLRSFMALLRDERERLRRQPGPQVLLVVEVDQVHPLNKQLGFAAGDAAMRHVTAVIGRHLRKTDRLGSSMQGELLMFLPNTPTVGAILVAERTQAAIKANPLLWKGQAVGLSLSMGLVLREEASLTCEAMLELGRQAVQRAQREGGARTRLARYDDQQAVSITPPV
jgi:diguanylate cyclase (GGDEF)-like protein